MDTQLQDGFRVGEFEVRPLEGRIDGPQGEQHLQPKVMEILVCLAEQPGALVERNTLIARGWGQRAQVTDDVLTRCISELRHHLDDHRDAIRYIQTIPRRGYRLVASVEPLSAAAPVPDEPGVAQQPDVVPAPIPTSLWRDLKRRKVVRVAVAYIIVAWVLMQVGEVVFDALPVPDGSLTMLLALLALGFPVAVVMAWAFQVTPDGVMVDSDQRESGRVSPRKAIELGVIAVLSVALAYMIYGSWQRDDTTAVDEQLVIETSAAPVSSIAVLRFLNIGGESHFADGLGEELIDRLARLKELAVAARTSSWAFDGQSVDVPTIAAQLSVDYVLEGSVQQSGDEIRVFAQLNDGRTGKHVWSQKYDRSLTSRNFFAIQSEIARQVARLLQISLTPEAQQRVAGTTDTTFEALDFYLRGQQEFRKPHDAGVLDTASGLFRGALDLDARFALAQAGLCDTELGRYRISRDVGDFENAEKACHRALTLDSEDARVQAALGSLYLVSGQNDKAQEQLSRAIAANPNLIDAYADLGEALENLGRIEDAEARFDAMVTRQGGYWYAHNAQGDFFYRQSRYADAAVAWERVVVLIPDQPQGYNNVAVARYMLGDFAAASAAWEKSIEIKPYVDNVTNLGLAYFYDGRYDKAAQMQVKALEFQPDDPRLEGRLATARFFAGDTDEADAGYRKAIALIEERLKINPDDIRLNRFMAVYSAATGDIQTAREAIAKALALKPEAGSVRFDAAKVALAGGDRDQALDYLEQARDLNYSRNIIRSDPVFAGLHDDARFTRIAQRIDNEIRR